MWADAVRVATLGAMGDGPVPPRPAGGLAPLRPPGGGGLAPIRPPGSGGLAPVSGRNLPSLPDGGGPLGPPRGGGGGRSFSGRSLNPATGPMLPPAPAPARAEPRPGPPRNFGARTEAPSPAPISALTASAPSPAPSPALVFMRPQQDPHEQASLLSDVTNVGGSGRSKAFPTQSVPDKDEPDTASRSISTTSSGSSAFNAGSSAHVVDAAVSRSGLPRGQAPWGEASRQTAQQVAAAVVNADQRPPPAGPQQRSRPKDTRKSISGGMKPEKKLHKEKNMKLVVHPTLGPIQPGGVAPPSDCQVIDERTWLTDRIVQFPCCSLSAMLLIPVVMAMVAALKAPFEIDISLSSFEIRSSHFSQQRYLAMNEAVKEENAHYTNRRQLWTPPTQRLGRLEMMYVPDQAIELVDHPEQVGALADGDLSDGIEMIRPDRLDYVRRIERAIQQFAGYEKFCRKDADNDNACSPPSSLITYLYPTPTGDCGFVYDGKGTSLVRPISETMSAMAAMSKADEQTEEQVRWFFSTKDTDQDSRPLEQHSTMIRSSFLFALDKRPTSEEKAEFEDWLGDLIDALEQERSENPDTNGVTYLVGGDIPTRILWLRELESDMLLALSSFVLVMLYTWFHTSSLVLSVMAMLMIALSFPVSIFFYYMFFGNAKLGVLNILSIYIVLGIGVDDCYVFLDAFQQNRHAPDLAQAFGAALNRSARAMFVTSFTTALAFLANMISSIPVIFSFAVFMATLVVVNYVFTITIFVGMVSVWHQRIESREKAFYRQLRHQFPCLDKLFQCCSSSAEEMTELPQELRSKPESAQMAEIQGSHPAPDIDEFPTRLEDVFATVDDETAPANAHSGLAMSNRNTTDHEKIVEQLRKHNIEIRSLRKTERYFLFSFGPFLNRNRRNIIGFATTLVVLSTIMAARLEPSRDIPQLFPSHHPVQLHHDFKNGNFTAGFCDDCGAPNKQDFMCHNVHCGGGNKICLFGKCYESERDYRQGNPMALEQVPYGFQKPYIVRFHEAGDESFEEEGLGKSISAAVAHHCNGDAGTTDGTAAMANARASAHSCTAPEGCVGEDCPSDRDCNSFTLSEDELEHGTQCKMANCVFSTIRRVEAQNILEHFMGVYLPQSELYATGCDDDYRECFAWSERGECDDNPGFMETNCKFSCGLCAAEVENYHDCHDGEDNDGDGHSDCADQDCSVSPACSPASRAKPLLPLDDTDRELVLSSAISMGTCKRFLSEFLDDCTMTTQRTTLKNALTDADSTRAADMGTGDVPQPV
eukprot:COSAG02_NODE_5594_length_4201_cov_51.406047_1_plen_1269_part_10